jgi:hypothetical protein
MEVELKRMGARKRVKSNPLLTKDYFAHTPGQNGRRAECELLVARFEADGGIIRVCPPEKTAAQLQRRKMGRPPKYGRRMTDAERKRLSRTNHNTLSPQERPEPGAVVPSTPFGPAVPGVNFIVERNNMLLEKMARQQAEILARLHEILERLKSAPPDYCLTGEEFRILAEGAAAYDRKVH